MDGPTTFTPVTQETFSKWCVGYKEQMDKLKQARLTEKDFKPTGKQIFESKMSKGIDDAQLEMEATEEEEFKEEEGTVGEEEEDIPQESMYDRALFAQEEGIQEDIDFE